MSIHSTHDPLGGDLITTAPAGPATAAGLIQRVNRWLTDHVDLDDQRRADITLATYEALANCVDHAYRGRDRPGTMTLQACCDPAAHAVRICISDHGNWMHPHEQTPARVRGRGMRLMGALADYLTVDGRHGGTTVCLHFGRIRGCVTAA